MKFGLRRWKNQLLLLASGMFVVLFKTKKLMQQRIMSIHLGEFDDEKCLFQGLVLVMLLTAVDTLTP